MRRLTMVVVAALAIGGCKSEPAAPQVHGSSAAEAPPPGTMPERTAKFGMGVPKANTPTKTDEEMCVDRFLVARKLNAFGDPEGTSYAGGTPLFDEATGKTTDRLAHVYGKQAEARACKDAPKP